MASPKLLSEFIKRLMKNADELADTKKVSPTSNRIPRTATKPVGPTTRGPGPEQNVSRPTLEEQGYNQYQRTVIEDLDTATPKKIDPDAFDVQPKVFGEGETFGSPSRFGKIEADDPIRDLTRRQPRVPKGKESITGSARAREQMDDLFGDETTRQADEVRRILNAEGVPMDRDVGSLVAKEVLAKKEVDQIAKGIFDRIKELEDSLVLPKPFTDAQFDQLRQAKKMLQGFKKEAAKVTADARKTGDISAVRSLEDRLVQPLKGSQLRLDVGRDVDVGRRVPASSDNSPVRSFAKPDPNASPLRKSIQANQIPRTPIREARPNISQQRPKLIKPRVTSDKQEFDQFIQDTLDTLARGQ